MAVVVALMVIACLIHLLVHQYYTKRTCDRCLGIGGWYGRHGWISCDECEERGYHWEKRTED